MTPSGSPTLRNVGIVLTPLAVMGVAWLLSLQLSVIDREIFERIMLAFGVTEQQIYNAQPALAEPYNASVSLLVLLCISYGSFFVGYKLSKIPRVVASIQILVVSAILDWLVWSTLHSPTQPIGHVSAIVLGCFSGYLWRLLSKREQRYEAQYYELMLRNRELQETRLQIVKQDEVERRMLAADLHDQVLNDLKILKQKFDDYAKSPDEEIERNINTLITQATGEIREVMDSLCPSALEHLGLIAAIEDCARRGGERGNFKARFKSSASSTDVEVLSMIEQSLLFRLVQESITNIIKHAGASTVRVFVDVEGQHLIVKVVDNGKGIDPQKLNNDSRGLRYMRQRADLIGATIAWQPGEGGKGTVVEIQLDLAARSNGAEN